MNTETLVTFVHDDLSINQARAQKVTDLVFEYLSTYFNNAIDTNIHTEEKRFSIDIQLQYLKEVGIDFILEVAEMFKKCITSHLKDYNLSKIYNLKCHYSVEYIKRFNEDVLDPRFKLSLGYQAQ